MIVCMDRPVIWAIFSLFIIITLKGNEIEDRIETQIDSRLPNSFKIWETHSVRQGAFDHMIRKDPVTGAEQSIYIRHWELFTSNYWYETRVPNTLCPIEPMGIAAACDWALLIPCLFGNYSIPPKTIFVHTLMLPHFAESTLRLMDPSYKFILVSGGHDITIPDSYGDQRYRNFPLRGFRGGANWNRIIDSPQVLHWFAENKDVNHQKMSALPTGMAFLDNDDRSDFPKSVPHILNRTLAVLNSDRVRDGQGQWKKRADVATACRTTSWCRQPQQGVHAEGGITRKDFLELVASVPFVACVQGGGLDPSPKAWESMLVGTIPIIERNTVSDAYEHYPVAFVNDWGELFSNATKGEEMLKHWVKELAPYYEEGSALRKRTLDRLKTAYWVERFHHKYSQEIEKQKEKEKEKLDMEEAKHKTVAYANTTNATNATTNAASAATMLSSSNNGVSNNSTNGNSSSSANPKRLRKLLDVPNTVIIANVSAINAPGLRVVQAADRFERVDQWKRWLLKDNSRLNAVVGLAVVTNLLLASLAVVRASRRARQRTDPDAQ